VLSIATGYSVRYLTEEVAKGRENYYTGAVAAGSLRAGGMAPVRKRWGCRVWWITRT